MSVPRFWREIPQRYNLQASKCEVCSAIHFPPREVCPTCRRASLGRMRIVKLSGRGTILESTRVHKPAPGYEMQVPYTVALVKTEEGPLMIGQIVDSPAESAVAGALVRSVFRRLGEDGSAGVIYYGTKWRVVVAPEAPTSVPVVAKRKGLLGRSGKPAKADPASGFPAGK